jgi:FSR family fosmidomycin resistance protein-like MFS transporter
MVNRLRPLSRIFLLTAGHGAVDSFGGMLAVLTPAAAMHVNAPLGDVVMLLGAIQLLTNLIQPVIGHVMTKRNLAWSLWFAVAVSCLPAFMGFAPDIWTLAALCILGAVGTGLYHPEGVLYAHDVTGEKAYLGIPMFMAGGAAIYAVATPLSIRLTETFGLKSVAWFVVPGLALAALFYWEYSGRRRAHPSIVARPRSMRRTKVVDSAHMSFWPLLAVGICFCIANGLFISVLSSHFELLYGPESRHWSGWVLMIMGVGASLSSFGWGALSKRFGFYGLAVVSQLVAVPLFLLMAHPLDPAAGFLFAVPLSLVTPAAIHPIGVMLSRNAAGSTQGMRTSLMVGGAYGLASIATMAAGVLMRRGVDSGYIIMFVAGCSATALLLSVWQYIVLRKRG